MHGRADPGSVVTINDYEVRVGPDGSFSEHIRRTGDPEIIVRATSPDGQFTEQSRPVPAGQ